jgi:hypothetical protein
MSWDEVELIAIPEIDKVPHREDAVSEIDEVERIASQMSWDDLADVRVQLGNDDADDDVQFGEMMPTTWKMKDLGLDTGVGWMVNGTI